jgi:hypothetical protein
MLILFLALVLAATFPFEAKARDDGRYANSPLRPWFRSLRVEGPCCGDGDSSTLSDTDGESKDGHYKVRIEDQWWDVPDDAVITAPNRVGRTIVWAIYYRSRTSPLRIEIRCFMPGAMI